MKTIIQDGGSVLMEFIVVLPIYIALFAGVFMVGDMSVKSIRLASADRTRAFDVAAVRGVSGAGLDGIRRFLFPGTAADEDHIGDESGQWYRHFAQPGYPGPWAVAVGAKVRDDYRLAPWTRGLWAFTERHFDDGTVRDGRDPGGVGALAGGGRAPMHSKDVRTRIYDNYVSYRRARIYSASQLARTYRAMPRNLREAGGLVDREESWRRMAEEPWPGVGNMKNDWSGGLPSLAAREYRRYFDGERARRFNL